MKNTSKKVMAAVLELVANTPETKEAVAIVERLAQYHLGYLATKYEWIESTKSHAFCVEFSNRLPFVAISPDLCTAIVLINQRIMTAFKKPDYDLTSTDQTALECKEVLDASGKVITDAFLIDRRTEFAA